MNRAHFMAQLRDGLAGLHHTDIGDIVDCKFRYNKVTDGKFVLLKVA